VTFDIDAKRHSQRLGARQGDEQAAEHHDHASSGLSKDEIERMKKEAEANAADDARQREGIEIRNLADSVVYSTEKLLREQGDKVEPPTSRRPRRRSASCERRSRRGPRPDQEGAGGNRPGLAQAVGAMYARRRPRLSRSGGAAEPGPRERHAAQGDVVDAEFEIWEKK